MVGGVGLGREVVGAGGEDVRADVAALFGPLVGLLGQHRGDQTEDGVAVGEDTDDVGAPADLLVQPLLGIIGPDLLPDLLGKAVKASKSSRAASRWAAA